MRLKITPSIHGKRLARPFLSAPISAGFPSPALDFIDLKIDLNEHLIKSPVSTYYGRVEGESMAGAGINNGDLLVIDKSIPPSNGKIAVCILDGEFTLKRIQLKKGKVWLIPENKAYSSIQLEEYNDFIVWGIVTYVIKKMD